MEIMFSHLAKKEKLSSSAYDKFKQEEEGMQNSMAHDLPDFRIQNGDALTKNMALSHM